MDDRNRQLGASTTAPTIAQPCTECRGFNVPALVRGNWQRGTCPACGGAGTAEAQQARSAAQVACATDGDFWDVVEPEPERATNAATAPWPTPAKQPAPAEAAGEVLPLWNHFTAGAMSRGAFMSARVWVAYVTAGVCMGRVDAWEGPPRDTADEAMRDADEAAKIAGHRLPADSMVFRPELADEVRGTIWEWVRDFTLYAPRMKHDNHTYALCCDATASMPHGQAVDAIARILRVHGADVREVGS